MIIEGRTDSLARGALGIGARLTSPADSPDTFVIRAWATNRKRTPVPVTYACYSLSLEFRTRSRSGAREHLVLHWQPGRFVDAAGNLRLPCPTNLFLRELAPGDTLQPAEFLSRASARDSSFAALPPGEYRLVLRLYVGEGTDPRVLERPVLLHVGRAIVR